MGMGYSSSDSFDHHSMQSSRHYYDPNGVNSTPKASTISAAAKTDGSESFNRKIMRSGKTNSKFHVALTATDSPYSQWQCRIMYYWYKKVKDMPGSDMGKLTRILHSGRPDQLMDEIPTFVVHPLPRGLDKVNAFLG